MAIHSETYMKVWFNTSDPRSIPKAGGFPIRDNDALERANQLRRYVQWAWRFEALSGIAPVEQHQRPGITTHCISCCYVFFSNLMLYHEVLMKVSFQLKIGRCMSLPLHHVFRLPIGLHQIMLGLARLACCFHL